MSSEHARKGPTRKIKKLISDIFFQHKINVCKYIVMTDVNDRVPAN